MKGGVGTRLTYPLTGLGISGRHLKASFWSGAFLSQLSSLLHTAKFKKPSIGRSLSRYGPFGRWQVAAMSLAPDKWQSPTPSPFQHQRHSPWPRALLTRFYSWGNEDYLKSHQWLVPTSLNLKKRCSLVLPFHLDFPHLYSWRYLIWIHPGI